MHHEFNWFYFIFFAGSKSCCIFWLVCLIFYLRLTNARMGTIGAILLDWTRITASKELILLSFLLILQKLTSLHVLAYFRKLLEMYQSTFDNKKLLVLQGVSAFTCLSISICFILVQLRRTKARDWPFLLGIYTMKFGTNLDPCTTNFFWWTACSAAM